MPSQTCVPERRDAVVPKRKRPGNTQNRVRRNGPDESPGGP